MKELRISVKLPKDLPPEAIQRARQRALETVVIDLWQAGHLSTRQAAARLGLTYYDFLDLLGTRGVPILTEPPDEQMVASLVQAVTDQHHSRH